MWVGISSLAEDHVVRTSSNRYNSRWWAIIIFVTDELILDRWFKLLYLFHVQ